MISAGLSRADDSAGNGGPLPPTMLAAVSLYRLADMPPLTAPVLVAAFDGWIDAAGASSAAVDHLGAAGEPAATFTGDVLYDYRARRPVLDIVDGTLTDISWPELSLRRTSLGERDLL